MKQAFDVIVVGGGHAGCEAALASARMGCETALVTLSKASIAVMSCNPCIGGVGKGQLVKEIDALGGEMGKNADYTGIQFRRLNTRKGSAVQSSRCQSDKDKYAERMSGVVHSQERLTLIEGEVKELLIEDEQIKGLRVASAAGASELKGEAVVITAGTFMRGIMHRGATQSKGGRAGEKGSYGLSDHLSRLGFRMMRLKTGTPPRLKASTLDFSALSEQRGDVPPRRFSFSATEIPLPQINCHLTFTNADTHRVISENLALSPLFSGIIKGVGPRYCPSIEDKVVKFPEKPRHQIFLEPETLNSDWIYPNGVSTSLPDEVQEAFIRTIPGCESAEFYRFGYAVEYDCVDARDLRHTLESRLVKGLYLAGQVNGTSGYEEAGCQGLVAGINAALKIQGNPPLVLSRAESYIGVLIDDLVSRGTPEPYRMFTSRAEFRLSLREDNADLRLRPHGIRIGLVRPEDEARFEERLQVLEGLRTRLRKFHVKHNPESLRKFESLDIKAPAAGEKLYKLLKRPEMSLGDLLELEPALEERSLSPEDRETIEIEVKYEGYIEIQKQEIERLKKLESTTIPDDFEYTAVEGLSHEVCEKLSSQRPDSLAQAGKISGVTPAALTAILAGLNKRRRKRFGNVSQ